MGGPGVGDVLYKAYLIVQWTVLSSAIILFNKYMLSDRAEGGLGFPFPLTLVLMHMCFVGAAAAVWKRMGWAEVPELEWAVIFKAFGPIAVFFAASLGFGNAAYLYISVAFVQMLKASTSVAVLLVSFALKLETPNGTLAVYIVAIASGVAWACAAQVGAVSAIGIGVQMCAVGSEALRLCTVQVKLGLTLAPTGTSNKPWRSG